MRNVLQSAKLLILLVPALLTGWALQATGLLADLELEHVQMLGFLLGGCLGLQLLAWLVWRKTLGLRALALGGGVFWLAQLVYYVGPGEVLVSLALFAGALALGSLLVRDPQAGIFDRLLPGVALMVSVVAWLLPFPVHDPRVYTALFALLLLLSRAQLVRDAKSIGHHVAEVGAVHPLLLSALVMVLGFASMGLWLPTLNYDDNSAHLAIQSQFLRDGYYRFDIGSQVWALAPWFNNTWHAIGAMLLGAESRAAVNAIWLLLGVAGAYRLSAVLGGGLRARLLAATVFASHPLTVYFGTSMQVDGPSAAVLLHLAAVLCSPGFARRSAWVPGSLIGIILALKMTNVVFLVLPCLYVTWVAFRERQIAWWARVVLIAVFTGGASYIYAVLLTGNPTFPMFNTLFQSPYYPLVGFSDPRWHVGISPSVIWDVTFNTPQFMEAYPGAIGMSLLVLLGGLVLSVIRPGASRWIVVAALLPAAALFVEIQYVRYVFPSLAIVGVLAVTALDDVLADWAKVLVTTLLLLCGVNLCLMANTSWIMRSGAWAGLVNDGKRHALALERQATPHHVLLDRMLNRYPDACVLNTDPGRPFTARMAGRAVSVAWYDPQVQKAMLWSSKDPGGDRWVEIIRSLGVSHVVVPKGDDAALTNALQTMGARWEDREDNLELWRIDTGSGDNGKCETKFFEARDNAHRLFHSFDTHR